MAARTGSISLPALPAQALAFPVPSSLGSLDQYIGAVKRFPLLTAEQEHDLALRWTRLEDLDAARQLVLSHLRLVVAVSRQYVGYGLPQADLIQEGNVGLMKAVRRFDPDRGVRLVSFALHWIKAEIHEYILRNWRLVKIATTKAQRKLFFNLRSMKSNAQTLSTQEAKDIATALSVKPEDVMEMEMRLKGQDIALDPQPDDDGVARSPIAYLTNPDDEPSRVLEHAENKRNRSQGLRDALAALDQRSRHIVESRWLREDDPATLQELADVHGVSAERIRQIEQKALKTLKTRLGSI
jgi:RNA polymerase sigma-32 factor